MKSILERDHSLISLKYQNKFREVYDGLYNDLDEDVMKNLNKVDPTKCLQVIKDIIDIIKKSTLDIHQWHDYINDLCEWQNYTGIDIFVWSRYVCGKKIHLDIKWDILKSLTGSHLVNACYTLELALSNAWFNEEFPSIRQLFEV